MSGRSGGQTDFNMDIQRVIDVPERLFSWNLQISPGPQFRIPLDDIEECAN
jgi:hypothetical protein